jgi:kynurenine formamidase
MHIRSFIIGYALVLAILLFADRRPNRSREDHYSHVVDLTAAQNTPHALGSRTHIIAPGAIIPGTWGAGQIPPERLVAPLVVIDLKVTPARNWQISLDDIAAWEGEHGMIPQGAVVAIRRTGTMNLNDPRTSVSVTNVLSTSRSLAIAPSVSPLPIERDAAQFLTDARYIIGFAVETPVNLASDRTMARQLALHGSYVLEEMVPFTSLPATGSLIIVAPVKTGKPGGSAVRVLAMVR